MLGTDGSSPGAWCPKFRVAEGELTWDCRVIQDCPTVYGIAPPRLAPQNQRSENRGRYIMGANLGHQADYISLPTGDCKSRSSRSARFAPGKITRCEKGLQESHNPTSP